MCGKTSGACIRVELKTASLATILPTRTDTITPSPCSCLDPLLTMHYRHSPTAQSVQPRVTIRSYVEDRPLRSLTRLCVIRATLADTFVTVNLNYVKTLSRAKRFASRAIFPLVRSPIIDGHHE